MVMLSSASSKRIEQKEQKKLRKIRKMGDKYERWISNQLKLIGHTMQMIKI